MENEQARMKFKTETVFSVVSRLFDGLLITEDEKLKMEILQPTEMKAAIYDLISEKDSKVAAKIFMAMRNVKDELQNPMEINAIVRNLFEFLKLEDLKTCRVVCKKWNFEAETLLRKKAAITFGYLDPEYFATLRHPKNFLETFSASANNMPFPSFRFLNEVEWRVSDLKNFFDQQKNNIKDLQLCGVKIFNENGVWHEEYKIRRDWFAGFSISKLTISCNAHNDDKVTALTLSSNILTSTTHITLDKCSIKIGKKLVSPIAIDFTDLKFWKNGNYLPEYCLNDLIDFRKAKDISLTCDDDELYTLPILDLAKFRGVSANRIFLDNIEVINWADSKVAVKTLILAGIPFLESTQMKIEELHIKKYSKINLSALPLSIEKIYFDDCFEGTDISCSHTLTLPNLKVLKMKENNNLEGLMFFKYCYNLRDIVLDGSICGSSEVLLNLEWITNSIQRMKLKEVKNIIGCGYKLKLEKLVLESYSLANTAKVLDKMSPNILVLQWQKGMEFETSGSVLLFLQRFKNIVVFIGPFIWDDKINVFERSPLMRHVDRKADYYVFENNQGRSIRRNEFEDMKQLDKD